MPKSLPAPLYMHGRSGGEDTPLVFEVYMYTCGVLHRNWRDKQINFSEIRDLCKRTETQVDSKMLKLMLLDR